MSIINDIFSPSGRAQTSWNTIRTNWFISLVPKFIASLFVLSLAFLAWRWTSLPPEVPLWYSRPWGATQLASPYWLILLPLGSLLIYTVNYLISVYFMYEYLIFTQMLFLSSLIVSLLSFFALIKVLFIVS